jgi:hypothetical protein
VISLAQAHHNLDHYGSLSATWEHSLHVCSQERLLLVSVSPPRDFPTFASLSPVFYFGAKVFFVVFSNKKNWPKKKSENSNFLKLKLKFNFKFNFFL